MTSTIVFVVARVLLATVFVGLGIERLLGAAGIIEGLAPASVGGVAFAVFELALGLMILVGWQVRWVALLLVAFLVVDAFLSHPFWRFSGAQMHGQLLHFLKNVSLVGGFLLLAWAAGTRSAR
jgi:putative oxidoreductase